MVQRILGNHPSIHAVSEPWLLLHPMYALQEEGIWTEYDASIAWNARQGFLQCLPQGGEDYFEGLRRMYGYLYEQALAGSGKSHFLDKTPRYYQIIPQIHRLFPRAQFIILLRNPLAVLCSVLRTWVKGSWPLLHRYKCDLLKAPKLLLEGINTLNESCVIVHYESFVRDPESEARKLCASLGLDFVPDIIEYDESDPSSWQHGDKVGFRQHSRPDPQGANKWVQDIEDAQIWRLARDYLLFLGPDTVNEMGYAYDNLLDTLSTCRPSSIRLAATWPLWLLVNSLNWSECSQILEHRTDQVLESLQRDGLRATWRKIVSQVAKQKRRRNALPGLK